MEARIELLDEVNCKIHGLSTATRRKLYDKFSYMLPHAYHVPAYKMGRWDGKTYFFAIGGKTYVNLLEDILPLLVEEGYEVSLTDNRLRYDIDLTPIDVDHFSDRVWPEGHPVEGEPIILRDYQLQIVNNFLENQASVQEVATGAGKCQPYDSKVLTDLGWKRMGDISIGDQVRTPDGSLATVLNVYEPGKKDIYEITFKDGRRVRCCEDHIWPIYNIQWRKSSKKGGPIRNITTKEIIEHLKNSKRPIGVQLATFENDTHDIELPLDPWLMGFLLGDGSFRNGSLGFSSSDMELVEKVSSKLHETYRIKHRGCYDYSIVFSDEEFQRKAHSQLISSYTRNEKGHITENGRSGNIYRQALIEMGLDHKSSSEKFIPEIYFNGSLEQRLEMIRGLVDSDGTVDKGSIYFTSASKSLAEGFARLIHSVGGIAKIKHNMNRTYVYKGERRSCKDSYTVATKFSEPKKLVSLSRKKSLANDNYQYGPTLKNDIISVDRVGHEPVRCIYIDHPSHLYLTDGYVVTHNTLITAALSDLVQRSLTKEQLVMYKMATGRDGGARTIVIVPNKGLVTQTEDDYKNLGLDVGVYYGDRKELDRTHTICTWQSLEVIQKNHKSGKSDMSLEDFTQGVMAVIVDECFDGDTLILTPDGQKKISEIQPGDKVINLDETGKFFKEDTVVRVHENLTKSQNEDMLELEFDNGQVIKVTANHEFMTDQGWIRADCLTDEMEIIDINTYNKR